MVLTSKDPNYQTKFDGIVEILTKLKDDEAFFSIDEFGPFAVKKRGAGGSGRHLYGASMGKVEGLLNYHCRFGTFAQPDHTLLLKQEEHPGDDQDDGSAADPISQLSDHLSIVGRSVVAHLQGSLRAH